MVNRWAALIDWRRPADQGRLSLMLRAAANGDGGAIATDRHVVGCVGLGGASLDGSRPSCERLVDRADLGLVAVGDVRLDGRRDLWRELGEPERTSDLELVVAAFGRWRESCFERLSGEFAVALWNLRQQELHVVRDPFGLRTVQHAILPDGGFAVATDARQLLAAGVRRDLDGLMVRDHLARTGEDRRRTYFSSIRRLPPGHRLRVRRGGWEELAYRRPPRQFVTCDRTEAVREYRRLFVRSVEERLESSGPAAIHASGGLDSSAVIGAAHELWTGSHRDPAQVLLLGATLAGFHSDEQVYIHAAAARSAFPLVCWDALAPAPFGFESFPEAPFLHGDLAMPAGDLAIARERGIRVLLTGTGGDQVHTETGLGADLVRSRSLRTLLRELRLSDASLRTKVRYANWATRTGLVPRALQRSARLFRARRRRRVPKWAGSTLRAALASESPPSEETGNEFLSETQRFAWRLLTLPQSEWVMHAQVAKAADAGVALRCPFYDRRLVDFVLSIAPEHRTPHGQNKRLHRDAIGDLLPEVVKNRQGRTDFSPSSAFRARRHRNQIRDILNSGGWALDGFVERAQALAIMRDLEIHEPYSQPNDEDWLWLERVAILECWLRALNHYNARPEVT